MSQIPSTLFLGQHLIQLPEVESTNTFLLELLRSTSLSEGTTVIAHAQTAGRGQRGNRWEAKPGENLTFSFLLRPIFLDASHQFSLTQAIALSVYRLLIHHVPNHEVRIKWPNDILVNGKKIAGMLIESSIQTGRMQTAVVGIGLNLNQEHFGEDLPFATSLRLLTGETYDPNTVAVALLEETEKTYLRLRAGGAAALNELYLEQLYLRDEEVEYTDAAGKFRATLVGVAQDGRLQLRDGAGNLLLYAFKEVVFPMKS